MDINVKTKFEDQMRVITDVGCRYKAAESNTQALEAEIRGLEATASKTKRLMDSAGKAQLIVKAAKDRARLLAEHVTATVRVEAGKTESGVPEPHDAADSVATALKTMEAAKAATVALEALDQSLRASREVCALTAARISTKRRELGTITKDKESYQGLLAEEVQVGKALLDIVEGNPTGEGKKRATSCSSSVPGKTQPSITVARPLSGSTSVGMGCPISSKLVPKSTPITIKLGGRAAGTASATTSGGPSAANAKLLLPS